MRVCVRWYVTVTVQYLYHSYCHSIQKLQQCQYLAGSSLIDHWSTVLMSRFLCIRKPLFFLPDFISLPPFFSYRHFRSLRNSVSYLIISSHYFSSMPTRHLFASFLFFSFLFLFRFKVDVNAQQYFLSGTGEILDPHILCSII